MSEEEGTSEIVVRAFMVFFMQSGFSTLEAGRVRAKNVQSIMFKNMVDVALGGVLWYLFGWGFAFGEGTLIGGTDFCVTKSYDYDHFFFQLTFCVTACTICSGCLAERCNFHGYLIFVVIMTSFIYPIVCFWLWNRNGPFAPGKTLGVIDFAGAGVVHLIGGISGLMGSIVLGPRMGRFGHNLKPSGHSAPLQVMGTFLLWFGWYSFNTGSIFTYRERENAQLASRIAVTTTLSGCCSILTTCIVCKAKKGYYDLCDVCNSLLTGLVGITGACATVEPYYACLIGVLSAFAYEGGLRFMEYNKIDDPLDAASVHGFGGLWGMIAAGIFSNEKMVREVYVGFASENWITRTYFHRIWPQIVVSIILLLWAGVFSWVIFYAIDHTVGLRVSEDIEKAGLDTQYAAGEGWLLVTARRVSSVDPDDGEDIEMAPIETGRSSPAPQVSRSRTEIIKDKISRIPTPRSWYADKSMTGSEGDIGASKHSSEYTIDDVFRNDVQFTMMSEDAGMPESSC